MAGEWATAVGLVAVLGPLVGVPLTVIALYLKGLRDQQTGRLAELSRQVEALAADQRNLAAETARMHRDFATKEEWLREAMWARDRIERLRARSDEEVQ